MTITQSTYKRRLRLRDVINLVTSIEIPLPDSPDSLDENDELLDGPTILPK